MFSLKMAARLPTRVIVSFAVLAAAGHGYAATIDFETFPTGQFTTGTSVVEAGFQVTSQSGNEFYINTNGNPGQQLSIGSAGPVGAGDTIRITREGGGTFTFESFDLRSWIASNSDAIDLVGLVSGTQTQILANVFTNNNAWTTQASGFTAAIDELRIVGAQAQATTLLLDNLVLGDPPPSTGSITDGGAEVRFNATGIAGTAAGGFSFDLRFPSTTDHGFEMGWFIRTDADATQVRQPAPTTTTYAGDTATFTWNNVGALGLSAVLTVTVEDGSAGQDGTSGASHWSLTVNNPTGSDRTVNLFAYADLDVGASAGGDAVALIQANDWLRITDTSSTFADFYGNEADLFKAMPFPQLRTALNGAAPLTLDNGGVPFTGDFTGAFQWQDRTLPANGGLTVEWILSVNEPAISDTIFADGFEDSP